MTANRLMDKIFMGYGVAMLSLCTWLMSTVVDLKTQSEVTNKAIIEMKQDMKVFKDVALVNQTNIGWIMKDKNDSPRSD